MHSSSPPHPTSSKTGTFYFAYGSNLSPEQMAGRCIDSPTTSSIPIAVARLDGRRWLICQRGYANVVPSPSTTNSQNQLNSKTGLKQGRDASSPMPEAETQQDGDDDVVYGIIYNLTPRDESILDSYEGHSTHRNPDPTPNPSPDPERVLEKPFLQGSEWDYNKLYLPVTVTRWLRDPREYGVVEDGEGAGKGTVRVLVYVDEVRTGEGEVQPEYVGRMNRAIEQGVQVGMPRAWVEGVMRRWILKGVGVETMGDLGRSDGYWSEEEETETGTRERGEGWEVN